MVDVCGAGKAQYFPQTPLLKGIELHLQVLGYKPCLGFIQDDRHYVRHEKEEFGIQQDDMNLVSSMSTPTYSESDPSYWPQ